MKTDRRAVLAAASASAAFAALDLPLRALAAPALGPGNAQPEGGRSQMGQPAMGQPFSFDALTKEMQLLATRDYALPSRPPQRVLDRIDYENHSKIKFNTDCALFRDGPGQFPVTLFPLGRLFPTPVRMYALAPLGRASSDGNFAAHEIVYDPACFTLPPDSPARELPKDAGFAGFRFQESRLKDEPDWHTNDWVAFLGASYFRAIGEIYQYGLSARGVAINVSSAGHPEEFPNFTRFYFVPPQKNSHEVIVYAALDGPSITGAYRFDMHREKAVLMEIEARLFLRRDVSQLGLAPLTSMYWFSETAKPTATDWRAEVHDSDGLAMWTGTGEHIWRPLNNGERPATSNFTDKSPRGFGLLQRDRVFDHYLDGVRYDRRPSLWVEPLENWGEGSVTLVELPTDDESEDNIVAMWVPRQTANAGANFKLRYRLHWAADEPHPSTLARCFATRLGRGGEPGRNRPPGVRKFVVEFTGGRLANLPSGTEPQPILTVSSGTCSNVFAEAVPDGLPGHWRASFDCTAAHPGVIEMRLFLKGGDQTLSETWLYQYTAD
jgi:glucans biosynthesis protein